MRIKALGIMSAEITGLKYLNASIKRLGFIALNSINSYKKQCIVVSCGI